MVKTHMLRGIAEEKQPTIVERTQTDHERPLSGAT
jgi:hypothetical protein